MVSCVHFTALSALCPDEKNSQIENREYLVLGIVENIMVE